MASVNNFVDETPERDRFLRRSEIHLQHSLRPMPWTERRVAFARLMIEAVDAYLGAVITDTDLVAVLQPFVREFHSDLVEDKALDRVPGLIFEMDEGDRPEDLESSVTELRTFARQV